MKNIVFATFFFVLVLPGFAGAATFNAGETYTLQAGKTVPDNLYVGAGDISVSGAVFGDLVAAGGSLTASGAVRDDLTLAGGNITVLGSVGGDARIAGGSIVVGGSSIGGDLVVAGGTIKVLSGTTVGKDVVLTGGMITFSGAGEHNARFAGGQVVIEGTIQGDVVVDANEKIILGETARIEGTMTYRGAKEDILEVRNGAVVVGGTQFEKQTHPVNKEDIAKGLAALFGIFFLMKILVMIVAGIVAVLVFRVFSQTMTETAVLNPWGNLLRGLVVLVVTPIAAAILLVTILGAFIGAFIMIVYGLFLMAACLYSGIIFGTWIHKIIKKEDIVTVTWQHVVIGVAILGLIRFVPIIGWIVGLGIFLVSLGTLSNIAYQRLWMNR